MGWLVGSPPTLSPPTCNQAGPGNPGAGEQTTAGKALWALAVGRGESADLEPEAVWLWAGHLLWLGLC